MRANDQKRWVVRLSCDCAANPVAAILAYARLYNIDWTTPDCVELFQYNFANAAIMSISERKAKTLKRGLRGDALPGVAHARVPPRCVENFMRSA